MRLIHRKYLHDFAFIYYSIIIEFHGSALSVLSICLYMWFTLNVFFLSFLFQSLKFSVLLRGKNKVCLFGFYFRFVILWSSFRSKFSLYPSYSYVYVSNISLLCCCFFFSLSSLRIYFSRILESLRARWSVSIPTTMNYNNERLLKLSNTGK